MKRPLQSTQSIQRISAVALAGADVSVLQPLSSSAFCSARPNIIIFLADDMGYDDSSAYGGWIKTPRMEKLAVEGLRFTDFHASGAVCSLTRAGLLTGRYQQHAGICGTLRETGLAENTTIFFFSDNGATKEGSNAPLPGHKGELYEGGHRSPAIAWWPGRIKPGVTHDLTISLDLMPTVVALAGIPPPKNRPLDGVSPKTACSKTSRQKTNNPARANSIGPASRCATAPGNS